jgi:hypothetical protein
MSIKNGAVKYLVKGAERSLKLADIAPVRLATGRWASTFLFTTCSESCSAYERFPRVHTAHLYVPTPTLLPGPKISKLQLARIRNEAVVNGNVWPLDKPANNKPVVYKGQIHMLGKKKRYVFSLFAPCSAPL